MLKPFGALFILFIIPFSLLAQSDWKLSSDKEGIKIYTSLISDSKIKAIKVESTFPASLSQLVALVMDVKSCPEWVYHTKSCILLKQVSPAELYYYSEVNLPWPTQNRDFIAHLTVIQDPVTRVVTIDGPAEPGLIPPKPGIVRINHSKGKWVITPLENNRISVVYTLHVEPGGNIPAWMVNLFATEGPEQIFKKLTLQLQKPVYKNARLAYIQN